MKDKYNVFDYYLVPSHVHNLSSIYKLLSTLLLAILLIVANSLIDILVINFYLFVIMLWSNVSFRLYISNISIFRFLILVVFLIVSFFTLNIFIGLFWMVKLIDIIIYLAIVTVTTSLNDMVNGMYRLLKIFKNMVNINEVALKFGMFFKFFNIFYNEYNRVKISKKLRGVRLYDMNFFDKVDYIVNGIKPVFMMTLNRLNILKNNMYIKNYGISESKSNYRLNKWRKVDTILLLVDVILIFIIFIY